MCGGKIVIKYERTKNAGNGKLKVNFKTAQEREAAARQRKYAAVCVRVCVNY